MELAEVHALVERVARVPAGCADRDVISAAVGDLRRLRSWVEGREVVLAGMLAAVVSYPQKSLADAGRSSVRDAERVLRRAETTSTVPELAVSLDGGRVGADHVDVFTAVLAETTPAVSAQLVDDAARLVSIAETSTADEFARRVRGEARRLERDSDGLDRFERQRRSVRLRTWIDRATGMGRWAGWWDPESMLWWETRLDAQVEAMFHDRQPDGCPTDPYEQQAFLRALALRALVDGGGVRLGRPEMVIVVDQRDSEQPVVDVGLPVELPDQVLADIAARARVSTVTVADGAIVDAPGRVNLGRDTRLASRAQRIALAGLYPTCAIPGCQVRYSRTKLHHVTWWRHGGPTDLANLIPVCEHHHHAIHTQQWNVTINPQRTITIQLPDGTIMTTGPPKRDAA